MNNDGQPAADTNSERLLTNLRLEFSPSSAVAKVGERDHKDTKDTKALSFKIARA